jgi:predicted esterase
MRPDRRGAGKNVFPPLPALWTAVVSAFVACSAPASADEARIGPSIDGYVGAWLHTGPLSPDVALRIGETRPSAASRSIPWRPVAHSGGALDLVRELRVAGRTGTRSALGGILRLEEPLEGLLMVGADGELAVFVDGELRHQREGSHLRGSAWDLVPLDLPPGDHVVVLRLRQRLPHWAVAIRIVGRSDLSAPPGMSIVLPDVSPVSSIQIQKRLVDIVVDAGATALGFRPSVTVKTDRGVVSNIDRAVSVLATRGERTVDYLVGTLPGPRGGTTPFRVELADPVEATNVDVTVRVGAVDRSANLVLDAEVPRALAKAEAAARLLQNGGTVARTSRDVLSATLDAGAARLRTRSGSPSDPQALHGLVDWADAILSGRDPLDGASGIVDIALPSPLDGASHRVLLHVPAERFLSSPRPLVVALHGYRGTPEGIMEAFLGRARGGPHEQVDGFVLAPEAFGDAFYRGPGEAEVLHALDWVRDRYRVDEDRIAITGVSMGGTGTAHVAFRYADRFSAAAPLAGYHSYFVRRDTKGKTLSPWEVARMHHWSPASWAENGRNLPLYVAHGTRDFPLENSRVLTDRYTALGYPLVAEWPEIGHSVWRITYRGARMWPILTSHHRKPAEHVTIKTDALRYGTRHWATVTALSEPGTMGTLDVAREGAEVTVHSEGILGFALDLPRGVDSVRADGDRISTRNAPRADFVRQGSSWRLGTVEPGDRRKRAGLEGPIRDAYLEPLVFVYGTRDPKLSRANREIATHFATVYSGSAEYPVLADFEATPEKLAGRGWFLVGPPGSNRLTARIDEHLPFRVRDDAIVVGDRVYRGPGVGSLCIHPNPLQPEHYVVVLQAPDAAGIWRAASLPKLLPDYVVYDDEVAAATAEQILGQGRVRLAGFFRDEWSLAPP